MNRHTTHKLLRRSFARTAMIGACLLGLATVAATPACSQEYSNREASRFDAIRKRLDTVESEFNQLLGVQEQMVRSIENSRLLSGRNAEAIEKLNSRVDSLQQQVSRLREQRSAPTVSQSVARREREPRSVQLEPVSFREEPDKFNSYSRPQRQKQRRKRSVSYGRPELPGDLLLISSGGGFAIETGPLPDPDWMMGPAPCGPPVDFGCPCCGMPW